ncbi:MAG: phosphoribosyltransferase [Gammaproteobacteria bacterium]|nr:MAG: phosphoribosyltransferase [Gammaproteobacteria bacterium]
MVEENPTRAPRIIDCAELRERIAVFRGREEAGRVLAGLLAREQRHLSRPLLLAIPSGGVPVALAAAGVLGWPLDIAPVSKITLPWNSEAGYGAVAFDGTVRLNEPLLSRLPLTRAMVEEGIAQTRQKVQRRLRALRGDRPPLERVIPGHDAILVDDGLASGFTMLAAVEAVRHCDPASVSIAVPTGSRETVERLAGEVDRVWCCNIRSGYPFAVADAYRNWYDLTEEEVLALLETSAGST